MSGATGSLGHDNSVGETGPSRYNGAIMKLDGSVVAKYAEQVLNLASATLSEEYRYQCLPLCVIDTVFSISINYAIVHRFTPPLNSHSIPPAVAAMVPPLVAVRT